MTPAETRERLSDLHQRAKAAGLRAVVGRVDIALATASALAIRDLEAALADPGIAAQHEAIVESLDAEPEPARPPIAPPRKPVAAMGAAPSILMPAIKPPPKAPRKVTGPDAMDEEISF